MLYFLYIFWSIFLIIIEFLHMFVCFKGGLEVEKWNKKWRQNDTCWADLHNAGWYNLYSLYNCLYWNSKIWHQNSWTLVLRFLSLNSFKTLWNISKLPLVMKKYKYTILGSKEKTFEGQFFGVLEEKKKRETKALWYRYQSFLHSFVIFIFSYSLVYIMDIVLFFYIMFN